MRRNRLVSISLILLALAGGAPCLTAADTPAKATAAQELMRQRKPKEAIPQLVQIIEGKRDKLEEAADALIHLVKCFQLLKGDPAAEKQYAELAAKYLSKPPPLDGKTLPTLDQTSEDLLWKSWVPGQECRYSFSVGQVEREIRLESQDGPATSKLSCDFNVVDSTPADSSIEEATAAELGKHLRGVDAATAARLRLEAARMGSHKTGGKLTSAAGDGAFGSSFPATAKIGDRTFPGKASFSWGSVRVEFDNLPEGTKRIDELSASLLLAQPRQMEDTVVPLSKGATWTAGDQVGTVTDVTVRGNATTVKLSVKSTGGRAGGRASSGSSSSSTSTTMIGGGDFGDPGATDPDAPICLVTPDGRLFTPRGQSMSSINGNATMELTFQGAGKADKLRLRRAAAMSEREVPLKVTDIKLP